MDQNPIKILHIMSAYGGGISSFIRNKLSAVDKRKIVFDVVTFNDYPQAFALEVEQMGGQVYQIPNPKKEGFLNYFKTYLAILKNNGPYDMIHCHVAGHRALTFYLLSRAAGVKRFIVHAHRSQSYYENGLPLKVKISTRLNQMMNRFSARQMVSCGIQASEYYFGKKPIVNQIIMHIPNSIDLDKYCDGDDGDFQARLKEDLHLPENHTIIGHVGRFDDNKNHSLMLDIIATLKKDHYSFTWLFIGTGVNFDKVKEEIHRRGLNEQVRLLGRREDLHRLYPLMDVFVLPSFSEGLPTVCIESQAAGVPCVVSDTITREIDMGLGMVRFLPLKNAIPAWVEAIKGSGKMTVPDQSVIQDKIIIKKFSNQSSGRLYEAFVLGDISHYEI